MFEKQKQLLVDYGLRMLDKNLTTSTGGNISLYVREEGVMLVTPSSVEYEKITKDDIVEMTLDGKQLSANHRKPSSEWRMHAQVYQNRDDVNAMFHSHAVNCAAISTVGPLPAIDYLVAFGGSHEVPLAGYAQYGTQELAEKSTEILKKDYYAVLLKNHGINTIGKTLGSAFTRLELLNFCADMYIKAKIVGEPSIIPQDEMVKLVDVFKNMAYGITDEE